VIAVKSSVLICEWTLNLYDDWLFGWLVGWLIDWYCIACCTRYHLIPNSSCCVEHLDEVPEDFRPDSLVEFDDIVTVSAKRRWHTDELKLQMRRLLDLHAVAQSDLDGIDRRWEALQMRSSEHYGRHLVWWLQIQIRITTSLLYIRLVIHWMCFWKRFLLAADLQLFFLTYILT